MYYVSMHLCMHACIYGAALMQFWAKTVFYHRTIAPAQTLQSWYL